MRFGYFLALKLPALVHSGKQALDKISTAGPLLQPFQPFQHFLPSASQLEDSRASDQASLETEAEAEAEAESTDGKGSSCHLSQALVLVSLLSLLYHPFKDDRETQ